MTPAERKAHFTGPEYEQVERNGCDYLQKKSYPTRAVARVKAARTAKFLGKRCEPYKCPACKRWHLTTHPL